MTKKKYVDIDRSPYSLHDIPSFGLLRTNPKLSTNARIMTNGEGIWLESFNAHETLANESYKHFRVSPDSIYNRDLAKFYADTDYSLPYVVGQEYSDMGIKDRYSQQYETMYWYGCEYIDSLEYDEEMGLLAPLWIGEQFPDYFVIFRIDDPSYLNMKEWLEIHAENDIMDDMDFKKDILDRCDIVSCFDLRDGKSPLGTYLHNYISQTDFPQTPLEVSVEKSHETTYRGIDIENGGFKSISEMQYSQYFETDQPIMEFDNFITGGFERHRIACANILNIEFLFNDTKSEEYKFSRYFGLYCNKIELGAFEIDFQSLRTDKYVRAGERILRDERGVSLPVVYHNEINGKATLPLCYNDGENGLVQWMAGKGCICYAESNDGIHKIDIDDNPSPDALHIVDKVADIASFAGFVSEDTHIAVTKGGDEWYYQQIYFDILDDIPPLVTIEVYKGDELLGHIMTAYETVIPDEDVYEYVEGWQDGIYFCGKNSDKSKIARMVKNAFRAMGEFGLDVYSYGNRVIISTRNCATYPYRIVMSGFEHPDDCGRIFSFNSFVERTVDESNNSITETITNGNDEVVEVTSPFQQGVEYGFRFIQRNGNKYISVGENDISVFDHRQSIYLPTNTSRKFGEVVGIAQCLSNAVCNDDGVITEFDGGLRYDVLIDCDNVVIEQDNVSIYKQYIPTFGVFSYFTIKDIDTYTGEEVSIYGDMGELRLEKELYGGDDSDQSGDDTDEDTETTMEGGGSITLNGTLPQTGTEDDSVDFSVKLNIGEHIYFEPARFGESPDQTDMLVVQDEDDPDLYHVTIRGWATYTERSVIEHIDVSEDFKYASLISTINVGKSDRIPNEYDRYFENYNATECLVSRVAPYVCKWVQGYNGRDVREKPYRLTNNNAFGEFNFSPSVTTDTLDTRAFTQEWMYILDIYPYPNPNDWKESWSYMGFDETELPSGDIVECLLSDDTDYFVQIFSSDASLYDNFDNDTAGNGTRSVDILDYRNRWSIFSHGTDNTPSVTYFHGIGVEILDKSDYTQVIDNNLNNIRMVYSDATNGYRFSAVIVPTEDVEKWSSPLLVVRNDIFKFVCVVRYIPNKINSSNNEETPYYIGNITRTLLYNYSQVSSADDTYDVNGIGKLYVRDIDTSGVRNKYTLYAQRGGFVRMIRDMERNKIRISSSYGSAYEFRVVRIVNDSTVIAEMSDGIDYPINTNFAFDYVVENIKVSDFFGLYDKCVFSNIYNMVNTEQKGNVSYLHIDADGRIYRSDNGDWSYCIRFLPRMANAKYNYLVPAKNLSTQSIDYFTRGYSISRMVRNNGFYEPLFRDILYFKDAFAGDYLLGTADRYQTEFLRRTRGANTEFAWKYEGFGLLPLLYFHRVNDGSGMISRNDANVKSKIMPLVNVMPVGSRCGVNVFDSNFDPYYYTLTVSTTKERFVHGTSSMAERKSFLGSKHLKVPDEILIESFDYSLIGDDRAVRLAPNDVVVSTVENRDAITFSVNGERILRKSLHESLRPEMEKWVAEIFSYGDKETIDDDIDAYIDENLLKLYRIKDISLWVKDASSYSPVQDYSYFGVDDTGKYTDGLRVTDDVTKGVYASGGLNTKLVYNIKKKKNYCFGMSIVFERR